MKKIALLLLVAFCVGLWPVGFLLAEDIDRLQDIKKAVKDNPNYNQNMEVRFLKVLITDEESGKTKVKVTLPIALVEIFIKAADERHLRINREEYDVDIKEIFQELKKIGPMALVEIYENGETVKIWLE